MALYDMRFAKRPDRDFGPTRPSKPVVVLAPHHNDAFVDIGFAVHEGIGVVAAAQSDGTVKLFSLRSGEALQSPGLQGLKMKTPITSLTFKTVPGEKGPSLFVGEGLSVSKWSWGAMFPDEEG